MPSMKEVLKTVKVIVGIGNVKKPKDWPMNGFSEQLKHSKGGFKDSIVSTATGTDNKSLILLVNAKIVDTRDQQILKYLKSKGIEL